MPVFEYKGLSEAGKNVSGLLEADSAKTLRAQLRKEGIFLTDVVGTRDGSSGKGAKGLAQRDVDLRKLAGGRISTADIAVVTRQLATLLKAGVPLVDGLSALVEQVEKERFKRVLSDATRRATGAAPRAMPLGGPRKLSARPSCNVAGPG